MSKPKDLTWDELSLILSHFGFVEMSSGKTGGSRRKFVDSDQLILSLHKPHPRPVVKTYVIEQIIMTLKQNRKIKND
nr:type II toxin-antitoxin system HicA family toxin [Dyadobacter sp. CY323]